MLLSVLIWGTIIYKINEGKIYDWSIWTLGYNALPVVVLSSIIFLLVKNIPANKLPAFFRKFISHVADLCFGAYLVSFIFDNLFYPLLGSHVPEIPARLEYYFIIVPAVYLCALTLSFFIHLISKPLTGWIYRFFTRLFGIF